MLWVRDLGLGVSTFSVFEVRCWVFGVSPTRGSGFSRLWVTLSAFGVFEFVGFEFRGFEGSGLRGSEFGVFRVSGFRVRVSGFSGLEFPSSGYGFFGVSLSRLGFSGFEV